MLLEVDEDISDGDLYVFSKMKITIVRTMPRKVCLCVNRWPWLQDIEIEENKFFCLKCGRRDHNEKDCKTGIQNNTRWMPKKNLGLNRADSTPTVNTVMEEGKGKDFASSGADK